MSILLCISNIYLLYNIVSVIRDILYKVYKFKSNYAAV